MLKSKLLLWRIGCPFSSVSNTKCVSWCTNVCIRLHQHTLLNFAHRCLNQPAVVTSVLTWQYHAPEQRDMPKDVSLFPDQPCGTHSLWQSVTSLTDSVLCAFEKTLLFCRAHNNLAPPRQLSCKDCCANKNYLLTYNKDYVIHDFTISTR